MKKTDKLKRYITNKRETKGITLIALVITKILHYDYPLKYTNNKGFLIANV